MKERPILFSAPMVRAILEGRKTQTRRAVKDTGLYAIDSEIHGQHIASRELVALASQCPYGQPGDRLWVRETTRADIVRPHTWQHTYVADGAGVDLSPSFDPGNGYKMLRASRSRPVTPSIHMPRWASRIDLEVTGVRVERLQDISEADAIAEGLDHVADGAAAFGIRGLATSWDNDPRVAYRRLWESINGPGSWEANPWVWVVEFKRVKP